MARSTYIYLIRYDSDVVSAHTVKHEANTWADRNAAAFGSKDRLQLSAIRDGVISDKNERKVEW
jgi:hypothetical protein